MTPVTPVITLDSYRAALAALVAGELSSAPAHDPLLDPRPRTPRYPRIGRPGSPLARVRGPLAGEVVVSTELDPYMSLKALAGYCGLSVRRLRDLLTDPGHPLPCYRIGGKILVRRSEFDAWAARYRRVGDADLDRIVAEALRDVRGEPRLCA